MKRKVLTVSTAYMCLDACMPALPGVSHETEGRTYSYSPGGRGLTAALTFTALGLDSVYCCCIADDWYGQRFDKFLSGVGIDRRFVKKAHGGKTGLQLTLVEDDVSSRIVRFPQANERLHEEDVEAAFTCYPDGLYLQGELSDRVTIAAAAEAREYKLPVFYQPCRKRGSLDLLDLGQLEIIMLDAGEVYSYCGVEPKDYDRFLAAAMALFSKVRTKYCVFRIPDRGVFIYDGTYHKMVEEYPSTYLDESGAQEVFGAALTAAYMETGSVEKAARCASAAYAIASSQKGDIMSVPSMSEIAEFLKKR